MVFFELLYVLNTKRKYSIAIVVGLLLGFSSLVRWIGVLLGVALVAQAVIQAKGTQVHRLRVILPECVSAAIGALIFISWKAKLAMQLDAGTAVARYHHDGWEFLNYFNPLAVVNSIGDLFFKSDTLFRVLHVPGPVSLIFCTLVSVVILSGVYVRIRSRKIYPSDFYVLVSVILLMFVEWKMARYLLPLAPFLVSYFVEGLSASGKKLETLLSRRMPWMFSSIIVLWLIMSFTSNLYLLVLGNANKSHAGLSPLRSPTAESFYGGVWRELYAASNIIANDSMVNRVAYVGPYLKYGLAFTGKPVVDLGELQAGDAIVIEKLDALPVDEFLNIDVIEKYRWNSIRLFYVLDSDVDGGHIDFRE